MTKVQRRKNQILNAQALGIPVLSYEAEIKLTKIARKAANDE